MVSRQLSQWVDIVMFVFSYSSPTSLDRLLDINSKFRNYRSDIQPDPHILLVGVVGKYMYTYMYNVIFSPPLSLSPFISLVYLYLFLFFFLFLDDVFTKSVSEIEVRRIASDIDNCRVFNTTLAQPSAVHNVFIDGKYMYMYTYMYMYMYVYVMHFVCN